MNLSVLLYNVVPAESFGSSLTLPLSASSISYIYTVFNANFILSFSFFSFCSNIPKRKEQLASGPLRKGRLSTLRVESHETRWGGDLFRWKSWRLRSWSGTFVNYELVSLLASISEERSFTGMQEKWNSFQGNVKQEAMRSNENDPMKAIRSGMRHMLLQELLMGSYQNQWIMTFTTHWIGDLNCWLMGWYITTLVAKSLSEWNRDGIIYQKK